MATVRVMTGVVRIAKRVRHCIDEIAHARVEKDDRRSRERVIKHEIEKPSPAFDHRIDAREHLDHAHCEVICRADLLEHVPKPFGVCHACVGVVETGETNGRCKHIVQSEEAWTTPVKRLDLNDKCAAEQTRDHDPRVKYVRRGGIFVAWGATKCAVFGHVFSSARRDSKGVWIFRVLSTYYRTERRNSRGLFRFARESCRKAMRGGILTVFI